jgi:molybdate transport system substrate-binding protein
LSKILLRLFLGLGLDRRRAAGVLDRDGKRIGRSRRGLCGAPAASAVVVVAAARRARHVTYAMLRYMPRILRLSTLTAVLLAAVLALLACGSDDADTTSRGEVVVSAATSLKGAFTNYGEQFTQAEAQFSFAGSDELAAQIRAGAKPDVFAAANTKLPEELFDDGLVERPHVFAANRLVLAVPAESTKVRALGDLARSGVTIVIGAPSVPIGSYTRKVLGRLDTATRTRILANVRSNEPDVGGISAKLTQGSADAGLLYVTDVVATNGRLKAIELPSDLQPDVAYGVAVVKGAAHRDAAQAFVAGLLDGPGAGALKRAGFRPPPAQ